MKAKLNQLRDPPLWEEAKMKLTSIRAAALDRRRVNHHTAAPIGRVMRRAVPATVPAKRNGHINKAYLSA